MCECSFVLKSCYKVYHSQHFDSLEFATPPSCVLQITMSLKYVHDFVTIRIRKIFTMTKVEWHSHCASIFNFMRSK